MADTSTTTDRADSIRSGSGQRIELKNLTKHYPGSAEPAVDNVTMEIPAGEIVIALSHLA